MKKTKLTTYKTRIFPAVTVLTLLLLFSCNAYDETEQVSLVSEFPVIKLEGGTFQSFTAGEIDEWEEPGYTAFSGNSELEVYVYSEEINMNAPGVYAVYYTAQNREGLQSTERRVIAVTEKSTRVNDLSGRYSTARFGSEVEMTCRKIHEDGLYEASEVMGYPGADMPGKLVDLGLGDLVLLSGEGDFGNYATRKGSYTGSALGMTVELLDEPNEGVEIEVTWIKQD